MHRCITYFILFYSSQLMANTINYDVTSLTKELFINPQTTFEHFTSDVEDINSVFKPEDIFIYNTDDTAFEHPFSYEKVLLDTSLQTKDNEQYSLQHYLHVRQKSFLTKGESTWLTSGAGVTIFESNNYGLDDKKAFSFSFGLHSNFILTNNTKLIFSSKIFANYLNNSSNDTCNDITCLLSNKSKLWLQKNVALNLSMTF